jgi:hypothetical protein
MGIQKKQPATPDPEPAPFRTSIYFPAEINQRLRAIQAARQATNMAGTVSFNEVVNGVLLLGLQAAEAATNDNTKSG